MATLISPGVSVTVSDESFYSAAGPGTVPVLVIATAQDKSNPDGSGTAAFTTASTAGELKLISSQRELLQSYGNPNFYSAGGNQLHGYELNEYGLLAAHSYLGLASRAYVIRADVDLGELVASSTAPTGVISNGTYWFDLTNSVYGVKKYNGTSSKWETVSVSTPGSTQLTNGVPKDSYGLDGDVAVVVDGSTVTYYDKVSGSWENIGGSATRDFQFATHLSVPSTNSEGNALVDGDFYVQTTTPNSGVNYSVKVYNSSTQQFTTVSAPLYANTDSAVDSISTLTSSTVVGIYDETNASSEVVLKSHNGETALTVDFTTELSNVDISAANITITSGGANVVIDTSSLTAADTDDVVAAINAGVSGVVANVEASVNADTAITFTQTAGKDIVLESTAAILQAIGATTQSVTSVTLSNFSDLTITASATQPTGTLADGTLWYDATVNANKVDLLEHNGTTWVTFTGTTVVAASEPTATDYSDGDVWLDSDDLENFPALYKQTSNVWVAIDGADQVTSDGIVFGDFRASSASSLYSDAPAASAYPSGILAWNKSASSGNVKSWDAANSRWVDASGNRADGSMYGLRKAVRNVVKIAMQAAITSNTNLRSENTQFNLVAAPGYPELLDEMLALSADRKDTVFVIGDTPFRLAPDNTSINNWATNAANATENGEDGLVSSSEYAALYYPSGLATNIDGTSVVVPASHMALRTFAFNDQVAFPWFAPAGFQRGSVDNVSSVGYIDATSGEYVPVTLNEGQRDTLYSNRVNPIAQFPGRGISLYGQKTLSPTASALDRINVARMVIYVRQQLEDLVKPFLFEPNDEITRSNAKNSVDRFLDNLVTQRGLFDFITVCDTSNNTPARIDRNELYIDVAIQPLKAVEYIYIPIRVQNTLGSTG